MQKKNRFFIYFINLLLVSIIYSQEKVTLSGIVKDKESNETIINASILFPEINVQVSTNSYGFFSITLPKGNHVFEVFKDGYQNYKDNLEIESNKKLDLFLFKENQLLDEVRVEKNKGKIDIKKAEMSVLTLEIGQIKKMPVAIGEVDVLKSLTFLPGVTNGGEASSGINVRGGAVDQNLIQLDEATIYNSSHLFGFFSVFNPDAIKDLKLYKGGIPSRYGSRVSSVLDIFQRDGNYNKFKTTGGIGLLSSRLLVEGPLEKGKSSFLLAGRGSYAHLLMKLSKNKNSAYFYDLNSKVSFKINDTNSIFFSGYFGRDNFDLNNLLNNTYGNTILNLRWNHIFSDKTFSNLSLIYSNYYYGLTLDFVNFNWKSTIDNFNLKYDFKYNISNKTKLYYGINSIYYSFNPGLLEPNSPTSSIIRTQLDKKYALENAIYIGSEQEITPKLNIDYGLRFSLFSNIGPQIIRNYLNNQAVVYNPNFGIYQNTNPINEQQIKSGKFFDSYNNLEPRFSLSYQINNKTSIKTSYNRTSQYLHLLSNSNAPTPLDIWTPSGKYIKPQIADQIAVGFFKNLNNDKYSLEIESFYKKVKNRIDYIDGTNLIGLNEIEQVILNGNSRAYGLEFMLRKNKGKLKGWIAYTLSKSEQQTKGINPNEIGINNGEWYSTPYDRTHNLAIVSNYKINEKWNFAANFTLMSGIPITFPNGYYVYQGLTIPTYGKRNEDRLAIFHHLDISATYTPSKNKDRKWKNEWVFGIYNVYNRKNPSFLSFKKDNDKGNITEQLSIFGIVPSITYNFNF